MIFCFPSFANTFSWLLMYSWLCEKRGSDLVMLQYEVKDFGVLYQSTSYSFWSKWHILTPEINISKTQLEPEVKLIFRQNLRSLHFPFGKPKSLDSNIDAHGHTSFNIIV